MAGLLACACVSSIDRLLPDRTGAFVNCSLREYGKAACSVAGKGTLRCRTHSQVSETDCNNGNHVFRQIGSG